MINPHSNNVAEINKAFHLKVDSLNLPTQPDSHSNKFHTLRATSTKMSNEDPSQYLHINLTKVNDNSSTCASSSRSKRSKQEACSPHQYFSQPNSKKVALDFEDFVYKKAKITITEPDSSAKRGGIKVYESKRKTSGRSQNKNGGTDLD